MFAWSLRSSASTGCLGMAPDSELSYLTSPQLEASHLEVQLPSTFIV